MSNEPENRVADSRVTDTYRALASERTPEHLNEKVLKMAAGRRTPYARARAWMRPAAWAATIGLSFAIVLELTQFPSIDEASIAVLPTADGGASSDRQSPGDDAVSPAPAVVPEAAAPAATEKPALAVEAERKRFAQQPAQSADILPREELAERATAAMQGAEELARAQSGSDNRADAIVAESSKAEPEAEIAAQMSMELAATRQEQADRQTARRISEDAGNAAAMLANIGDAASSGPECLPSEREEPDSWLDCIRNLRERGLEEQADAEYEEFQRLFPGFEDSVTDK